ncbi:MAG: NUDIX domain-containing protein [Alphaproteobacteria bacterium]|nr:NUDIX domain-containing protein [Alphaproteobacteria bacterium]
MPKTSAGLLVYRCRNAVVEVFLVHPGGPFWAKKDLGAWSIPKGEPAPGEDMLAAAKREFAEETGQSVDGDFRALPSCHQANGKTVHAYAIEAEVDESAVASNRIEIQWPPRSGRRMDIPEVDRGAWFSLAEARRRINKGQAPLIDALASILKAKRRNY